MEQSRADRRGGETEGEQFELVNPVEDEELYDPDDGGGKRHADERGLAEGTEVGQGRTQGRNDPGEGVGRRSGGPVRRGQDESYRRHSEHDAAGAPRRDAARAVQAQACAPTRAAVLVKIGKGFRDCDFRV